MPSTLPAPPPPDHSGDPFDPNAPTGLSLTSERHGALIEWMQLVPDATHVRQLQIRASTGEDVSNIRPRQSALFLSQTYLAAGPQHCIDEQALVELLRRTLLLGYYLVAQKRMHWRDMASEPVAPWLMQIAIMQFTKEHMLLGAYYGPRDNIVLAEDAVRLRVFLTLGEYDATWLIQRMQPRGNAVKHEVEVGAQFTASKLAGRPTYGDMLRRMHDLSLLRRRASFDPMEANTRRIEELLTGSGQDVTPPSESAPTDTATPTGENAESAPPSHEALRDVGIPDDGIALLERLRSGLSALQHQSPPEEGQSHDKPDDLHPHPARPEEGH